FHAAVETSRGEVPAVRAKDETLDELRMPGKGVMELAGARIPNLDPKIFTSAGGRQPAAVRTEHDLAHTIDYLLLQGEHAAGIEVPDLDFVTVPTGGSQTPPLRTEGQRKQGTALLREGSDLVPRF